MKRWTGWTISLVAVALVLMVCGVVWAYDHTHAECDALDTHIDAHSVTRTAEKTAAWNANWDAGLARAAADAARTAAVGRNTTQQQLATPDGIYSTANDYGATGTNQIQRRSNAWIRRRLVAYRRTAGAPGRRLGLVLPEVVRSGR